MVTEKVSIQKDMTSVNFSVFSEVTGNKYSYNMDFIGDLGYGQVMVRLKKLYPSPMVIIKINDIVVNRYTFEMPLLEFISNAKQISINGKVV